MICMLLISHMCCAFYKLVFSGVERLIFVMVLIVTISRESNFVYKLTASYMSYVQTSDVTDKLNSDRTSGKQSS